MLPAWIIRQLISWHRDTCCCLGLITSSYSKERRKHLKSNTNAPPNRRSFEMGRAIFCLVLCTRSLQYFFWPALGNVLKKKSKIEVSIFSFFLYPRGKVHVRRGGTQSENSSFSFLESPGRCNQERKNKKRMRRIGSVRNVKRIIMLMPNGGIEKNKERRGHQKRAERFSFMRFLKASQECILFYSENTTVVKPQTKTGDDFSWEKRKSWQVVWRPTEEELDDINMGQWLFQNALFPLSPPKREDF